MKYRQFTVELSLTQAGLSDEGGKFAQRTANRKDLPGNVQPDCRSFHIRDGPHSFNDLLL